MDGPFVCRVKESGKNLPKFLKQKILNFNILKIYLPLFFFYLGENYLKNFKILILKDRLTLSNAI